MATYDVKKLFGQRIKNMRKALGLTQLQLAETVGVDAKHISRIEGGKNFPSPEVIAKFADAFKIHPNELFIFENEPLFEDLKSNLIKCINDAKEEDIRKIFLYAKYITCI